jgi:hypothetical protein
MLFVGKTVYQKQLQPSQNNYSKKNNPKLSQKLNLLLEVQAQNFELHFAQALSFIQEKQLNKALESLDIALLLLKKEKQLKPQSQKITADNSITLNSFLHYYEYYISLYKLNILQKQGYHCEVLEELENNYNLLIKQRAAYIVKAKSEWALGENEAACKSIEKAKSFGFTSKNALQNHLRMLAAANYRFENEIFTDKNNNKYDYFKIRWQAFTKIEKTIKLPQNKCLNA